MAGGRQRESNSQLILFLICFICSVIMNGNRKKNRINEKTNWIWQLHINSHANTATRYVCVLYWASDLCVCVCILTWSPFFFIPLFHFNTPNIRLLKFPINFAKFSFRIWFGNGQFYRFSIIKQSHFHQIFRRSARMTNIQRKKINILTLKTDCLTLTFFSFSYLLRLRKTNWITKLLVFWF